MHDPVPLDVGTEIRELSGDGVGCNQISVITGINSSTVKRVISGEHQKYSNKLSARQIQQLLVSAF